MECWGISCMLLDGHLGGHLGGLLQDVEVCSGIPVCTDSVTEGKFAGLDG